MHASWCPIHGFTIRRRSYWQFTWCIHTYTYTGPPFQALADSLKDEYITWPPFQALDTCSSMDLPSGGGLIDNLHGAYILTHTLAHLFKHLLTVWRMNTWPGHLFKHLADNLKGGSPSQGSGGDLPRVPKTSPQAECCHKKSRSHSKGHLTDKKPQHPRFPCGPPPWY